MQLFFVFVLAEGRLQALKNSSICHCFVSFQNDDFCFRIVSRASQEAPATLGLVSALRASTPPKGPRHPRGLPRQSREVPGSPLQVAENVIKTGVPGKCAPRPRREAYFFKNRALTTGASTTFQIEVVRKSQSKGRKVAVAAARAQISF